MFYHTLLHLRKKTHVTELFSRSKQAMNSDLMFGDLVEYERWIAFMEVEMM